MGPCASIWGSDIIKRIHPSIRGIRGGGELSKSDGCECHCYPVCYGNWY